METDRSNVKVDRELLELAAKAAGIEVFFDDYDDCYRVKPSGNGRYWNPLYFDGDALRLAVVLHIGIRSNGPNHWQNADETIAIWDDHEGVPRQLRQEHDGDPYAATRRAIVRAAAAIGEQMS